jgi:hypothetical protein
MVGITSAVGNYILSLDADDELMPGIAEYAYRSAIFHHVDIVEFGAYEIVNATGPFGTFAFFSPPSAFGSSLVLQELFVKHSLNWNLWKRLIRRATYIRALNLLSDECKNHRIAYGEDKLHMGAIFLVANGYFYSDEIGYLYNRTIPDNSESEKQQSFRQSLTQLRYVERTLKQLYGAFGNVSYKINRHIPSGFQDRMEMMWKTGHI